jgi:dephospho-CoA kinase
VRVIGLTGGIGMGKSTAARVFARARIPVHDADAAVHALYARGGAAVPVIAALVPAAVREGAVDRGALGRAAFADPALLRRLEAAIHPLVRDAERRFLARARRAGARAAVLDIPLLFETGAERRVDAVIVVSAPARVQRARVLGRPGMTEEKLAAILSRQMADAEKRRRADLVVPTGLSRHFAQGRLRRALPALLGCG